MKFEVKDWWYEQEQTKAGKYNWTLCWGRVYEQEDEEGNKKRIPEIHAKYLIDKGEDVKEVGYYLCGDKVRETEKAIQVILSYWNLNKAGRYVTDAPVEKKWKTWIPKSVLI